MGIPSRYIWFAVLALFSASNANAFELGDGRLSDIVKNVRIGSNGRSVAASTNAQIRDGFVRTGADSRAEISFADKSVVRLGDNSVLNVDSKQRTFGLESGAMLTQVPNGVGGTYIKVRQVTATAAGTTLAVEFLPNAYIKFIALDGTSRLCLKTGGWGNDCVLLRAGQMIIAGPDAKALPESVDVDLTRFVQTCQFITKFRRLPAHDLLVKAAAVQRDQKAHGSFAETNLVIFGRGTLVTKKDVVNTPKRPTQVASKPGRSPQPNQTPPR